MDKATKSDIVQASAELMDAFKKLQLAADDYPSLLVYFGSEEKFAESFSAFVEAFEPRLDFFRRGINKFSEAVLAEKRKEKRMKDHAESKKKKRKKNASV